MIYKDGSTGYYAVGIIILLSLVVTVSSNSAIFRNFVFLLLFLNISISVIKLTPVTVKFLQIFFNNNNVPNKSINVKNKL